MNGFAGQTWVLPLVLALLGIAALGVIARLWRGPGRSDRVVAIDALTLIGVGVCATLAAYSGETVLLDVAALLALMAFAGTAAFALLLGQSGPAGPTVPREADRAGRLEEKRDDR